MDLGNIYDNKLSITLNKPSTSVSFLNLTIRAGEDKKFTTKVYTKKDSFKLRVVSFTHFTTNTTKTLLRGTVITQLTRFIRYTTNLNDFIATNRKLLSKAVQSDYPVS